MGWAKYYEDNMSIYVGRMALRDVREERQICNSVKSYRQVCVSRVKKAEKVETVEMIIRDPKQNGRKGLELSFTNGIDDGNIRKLQMNGWWWSKVNACWCNLDTNGNRKYAKRFASYAGMKLAVVSM